MNTEFARVAFTNGLVALPVVAGAAGSSWQVLSAEPVFAGG
jgi:hypothetical protein